MSAKVEVPQRKLSPAELHLIKLVGAGAKGNDRWAKVSAALEPMVSSLPEELVECNAKSGRAGYARLTASGHTLLQALRWL